jgi:glycosyltransferase involved in cell wall biosynthesis
MDVVGGIETLIGRMSRFLVERGHHVDILTTSSKKWRSVLHHQVRVVDLNEQFRSMFYPVRNLQIWRRTGFPIPDIIKTFDLPTSWCGALLIQSLNRPIRILSGIYNPNVFDRSSGGQVYMHGWMLYLSNYLRNVPEKSRLVCDPEIGRELISVHGVNARSHFWALPVDDTRFTFTRMPRPGQILSIGRLSPMKEYNLFMPDVVAELRRRGFDVTWVVYGSGPYEREIRVRAEALGILPFVELKGEIDYQNLEAAMVNAYVFVGMGTAIIEASLARIPSILALAYDRTGLTYGPLHAVPHGRIGQIMRDVAPSLHVVDELERILRLSSTQYEEECNRARAYAEFYSMNRRMNEFLQFVADCEVPRRASSIFWMNYVYAAARVFGLHLDKCFSRFEVLFQPKSMQ